MSGIQQRHEAPAITKEHDDAALSPAAKALQLYKEGESVPTIAKELEISVATVDSYLKISFQTAPTVQTPSTATPTVSAAKA
jgi:DNA-binding NarL/FixJ family response regulator